MSCARTRVSWRVLRPHTQSARTPTLQGRILGQHPCLRGGRWADQHPRLRVDVRPASTLEGWMLGQHPRFRGGCWANIHAPAEATHMTGDKGRQQTGRELAEATRHATQRPGQSIPLVGILRKREEPLQ